MCQNLAEEFYISVAFDSLSASISSLLGCNARIEPSQGVRYLARNKIQNRLDLIYRTFLIIGFVFVQREQS